MLIFSVLFPFVYDRTFLPSET